MDHRVLPDHLLPKPPGGGVVEKLDAELFANKESAMPKGLTQITTVVALGLALSACSSGGSGPSPKENTASDVAPKEVSVLVRDAVDTYDPYKSLLGTGSSQVFDGIYAKLMRIDIAKSSADETVVYPDLAASWDVKADSAVMTLKPDLTCADGSPLTATDIAKSVQRFADPETGAQSRLNALGAAGAKSVVGDDAAGTVTITLNAPYADLLAGIGQIPIICPKGLANLDALAKSPELGESGPYRMTDTVLNQSYTLTRRDDAAIEDPKTLPESILIRTVSDDTTRANLVASGDVAIGPVLGADAKRLESTMKAIIGAPSMATSLYMNQNSGFPTADKLVRQAITYAVDTVKFTRAATFDAGEPSKTLFTPNTRCYTEDNADLMPAVDTDKAKALLEEAGYGAGGKTLALSVAGYESRGNGPAYIAEALRAIGVEVDLHVGSFDQINGLVFGGDWDLFVLPLDQTSYAPGGITEFVSTPLGGSLNIAKIDNPGYDKYALEASGTLGQEGCDLWDKAEASLLTDADLMPLSWSLVQYFSKTGLQFTATYLNVDTRSIRVPR